MKVMSQRRASDCKSKANQYVTEFRAAWLAGNKKKQGKIHRLHELMRGSTAICQQKQTFLRLNLKTANTWAFIY